MYQFVALAALALVTPAAAQVQVDTTQSVDYLRPAWVSLDDGSQLALMATTDLNTVTLVRCWDDGQATSCVKASENWVTGYMATSIERFDADELPDIVMPTVNGSGCSQILDRLVDERSLINCKELIGSMREKGLISLAKLSRNRFARAD